MSLGHAFAALYSAIEILASMDADLSTRLSVVYRQCLRSLDSSSIHSEDTRRRLDALLATLAEHDPDGAAGAMATQSSRIHGLDSPAMEDLAREIVNLYMDLLMGGRHSKTLTSGSSQA